MAANSLKSAIGKPGAPVYGGGNGVDPTRNVLDLVRAAVDRIDDMADLRAKLSDEKNHCARELAEMRAGYEGTLGKLREEHQEKIQRAESGRLDSIRQVDREEVAKTAVAANTAITTLAKQTNDLAVTLAKTVADTAAAAEARNSAQYSDTNKRLSALELSSSEGKGKQTVADPQLERLAAMVETMARNADKGAGKTEGIGSSWGILLGVVGLIGTLIMIAGTAVAVVIFLNREAPAPTYVPAPQGTALPTTPQQVPR